MITLGIDPGLATIGFAFIEGLGVDQKILDFGVIETEQVLELSQRLLMIQEDLSALIEQYSPDMIFVEELFFSTNAKTALDVAHARGVILMCCATSSVPVSSLTPNQVKVGMCGDGRADKQQVQSMVQRQFDLSEIPRPDDAADALAIAYVGAVSSSES